MLCIYENFVQVSCMLAQDLAVAFAPRTDFSAKRSQTPFRHRQLRVIDHGHLTPLFIATWRDHPFLGGKVMDSWKACHEFDHNTSEDPPCREERCTLNMSRFKRPLIGVKVGREGVVFVTCS
ncbi:hypothetical protein TNCV_4909261 [Trichonephila clavipes]|uniref:Uncharacterized protein n=1 Tax=Trichonephila clavipes TaxID=2585209 RepID=A0A8X6V8E7_TRICX|nr:hypothetical protein TNCV_4909261 [Trichonephila clavipes]